MPQPLIHITCEKPAWRVHIPALATTVRHAALEAYRAAGWEKKQFAGEFSICFSNNREVRKLNRSYRGKDNPTNVLSFAACDEGGIEAAFCPATKMHNLGDIILAYETVRDEALEQKKAFAYHGLHLVVHGVLHLLGYDHQTTRQAKKMESLETTILSNIGIADPYRTGHDSHAG